ncbi:MAG: glutamine amidotransferase family protein [Candidatus Bathyarchaeia archaeon]
MNPTNNGITSLQNPYREDKVHEACGLLGIIDTSKARFSAYEPIRAMENMHDRGNGLGAGFAVYGLYPEHRDEYALHVMYLDGQAKDRVEKHIEKHVEVNHAEEIPTDDKVRVVNPPVMWRYFVTPKRGLSEETGEDEYIREMVIRINMATGKAFVFSSGKDMGVFKGVGYPEELADYFMLSEYRGYLWLGHTRFPTNTPGWWGGAHPFSILDWSVVHNGELSSYGANRRYLEMFGYRCTMQTDTEVMAYAFDLLVRRQGLPLDVAAKILAPPLWIEIDRMPSEERKVHTALRQCYGGLLMNGPFTIIVAHHGEMIGLTDRLKLRPLSAAVKGGRVYMASEEAAIRVLCRDPDRVWRPKGGEPVVGRVKALEVVREMIL